MCVRKGNNFIVNISFSSSFADCECDLDQVNIESLKNVKIE